MALSGAFLDVTMTSNSPENASAIEDGQPTRCARLELLSI
jgi:hypothetical protein